MKLYTAIGPSARTVSMFLAEKELSVPTCYVDILAGEHLTAGFRQLNPQGQLPFMVLDDGFSLGESLAICEYLEEISTGNNPLLGTTARERAETRMWCRRIDLRIMEPSIQGFKASDGYEFFKDRYYLVVSGAEELKTLSRKNLAWLNEQMGSKPYICGDRFSLADIQLFCFLDYNQQAGNPIPESLGALQRWFQRVGGRDSVAASKSPPTTSSAAD